MRTAFLYLPLWRVDCTKKTATRTIFISMKGGLIALRFCIERTFWYTLCMKRDVILAVCNLPSIYVIIVIGKNTVQVGAAKWMAANNTLYRSQGPAWNKETIRDKSIDMEANNKSAPSRNLITSDAGYTCLMTTIVNPKYPSVPSL